MNKILKIRSEKRATISEVIVRGKRDIKQNMNSFYFNFSVESSRLIFNNFITVKLRLTFKSRNRPVCNLLVLPECLSDSEANRDGADAEFFFFSRCFSLFLPHLRTLAHKERPENCVCFRTRCSGPSLCIHHSSEV